MKTPTDKPIVYIIDDDKEICHSLQWLLESVGLTVSIFDNGPLFLNALNVNQVGCILADIRMPIMSGLELQEQLIQRSSTLPIIFMTGHGDVPMAVRAMKAGAFDFQTKPFNDQLMLEQLQKAILHHRKILAANQQKINANLNFQLLTDRERQVLKLIVDGRLNKEIAYQLDISIKTVELHRSNIMQKMKVKSVAQLVKAYIMIQSAI